MSIRIQDMEVYAERMGEYVMDLIDRQAAIKAVSEYGCVWMEYSRGMTKDEIAQRALNNAKATMIRIVKELPAAEPKRGEWFDAGKGMILRWTCSECGRRDTHIYNFCPNCGADMRRTDNA